MREWILSVIVGVLIFLFIYYTIYYSIQEIRGKRVVILFVAKWAIHSEEALKMVEKLSNELEFEYKILDYEENKEMARKYGITQLPSFVIGERIITGIPSEDELRSVIMGII